MKKTQQRVIQVQIDSLLMSAEELDEGEETEEGNLSPDEELHGTYQLIP